MIASLQDARKAPLLLQWNSASAPLPPEARLLPQTDAAAGEEEALHTLTPGTIDCLRRLQTRPGLQEASPRGRNDVNRQNYYHMAKQLTSSLWSEDPRERKARIPTTLFSGRSWIRDHRSCGSRSSIDPNSILTQKFTSILPQILP